MRNLPGRSVFCSAIAGASVAWLACNKSPPPAPAPVAEAGIASAAPAPAAEAGAAPSSLALLNGFEGQIDAVVKESKAGVQAQPISLLVKGDKFRLDVPEQLARRTGSAVAAPSYVLVDSSAKKLYMVLDAQKQVMFFDMNQAPEMLKGFDNPGGAQHPGGGGSGDGGPGGHRKVTKTGHTETIAGAQCETWDIISDHREATVCAANEGASWFSFPLGAAPPPELAWAADLLDGKHFPLRVITYDKDGATETMRVDVTHIEKKSLAGDELELPASYAMVDLAKMMQGIAGMASGMHAMPHPPAREKK
ncbi:MAG: DUF4412 domain-containing protein [Polyangiaceae bacterium]|nr:DUF4412 domain-containing protein [Polyangiaceae bacterium]